MEQTPRANRIHIGIYGRCNSGKSSLINAITGQQTAVVSEVAGTTTDTVNKSMELPGVGAVTFIDTAGFDDTGELGAKRLEQTRKAADRTDVAVIVHAGGEPGAEREWIGLFGERNIPVVLVLNKADLLNDEAAAVSALRAETGINPIAVSALTGKGIGELIAAIAEACTHAPATEDIGRVKIPRLLRKRIGEGLAVDIVAGADFPKDLSRYDLVIHCGACMFNRRHVLSRLALASAQHIPMTNYGITIAHLTGILDRVVYPGMEGRPQGTDTAATA